MVRQLWIAGIFAAMCCWGGGGREGGEYLCWYIAVGDHDCLFVETRHLEISESEYATGTLVCLYSVAWRLGSFISVTQDAVFVCVRQR